jgi:glycosyltransferase involved in cell wall biosynthesis
VLRGQCIRSGAGLYYESYEEFSEALYSLESNGPLHDRLGHNGREYFRANYAWPVIRAKVSRHVRATGERIAVAITRIAPRMVRPAQG